MTIRTPTCRWLQYSLGTLLVLALFVSINMSWLAMKMRARRQGQAVETIEQRGGKSAWEQVPSKEAAFQVAARYLETVRPEWKDDLELPHKVTDEEGYWLVTFVLPKGCVGGTAVLHVDKQCTKVVEAYHEQ